jgi:hypothetical protein
MVLADLKPRVLFFDRWILNGDRILTESGGNPNLLWTAQDRKLHVIDHNNAFDEPFDATAFWQTHVFRASATAWDEAFQAQITPVAAAALACLDSIWSEMPEEWHWSDAGGSVPTNIDRLVVRTMLEQPQSNPTDFWRTAP